MLLASHQENLLTWVSAEVQLPPTQEQSTAPCIAFGAGSTTVLHLRAGAEPDKFHQDNGRSAARG